MKTRKLALRRMKNNAHFQFHTDFIEVISRFEEVKLKISPIFTSRYIPAYRNVDAAWKKIIKSAKTEQIQDADRARDDIWLGLLDTISAGLRHFNPEVRAASKEIKVVTDTYGGKNLARLPFNEQTSAIYNILRDLTQKYSVDVSRAGLTLWVEQLQNLNSAFGALMHERYDEESAKCDIVLKDARTELDKLYNAMIDYINALIGLEGEAGYEEFVRTLNAVIAKYRKRKYHVGSSGTEEEEIPDDDGDDDSQDGQQEQDI